MKTNSNAPTTLYIGLDVHKAETVFAMVTVSEIGTFSRFEHPKKLMAFLGLVPTENSSGTKQKRGSISKCGN